VLAGSLLIGLSLPERWRPGQGPTHAKRPPCAMVHDAGE
jgi:hypothetical protein